MLVALPFVEFVGAFADHVGPHGHDRAAMLARPIFGGFEQPRAGSEAPFALGDDQPIQFRSGSSFQEMRNTDVRPADDSRVRGFRYKQSVW